MTVEAIEGGAAPGDVTGRPAGTEPVERSYVQVIRVRTLVAWVPVVIGAVVSAIAGAAAGWTGGIGYARAGGDARIPPGATIKPREPRNKPR